MKHIVISALLALASTGAQAYQFELEGGYARENAYINDVALGHVDAYSGKFNFYFKDLSEQTSGPIALRSFMSRSSLLSLGYTGGEDNFQLNGDDLAVLPGANAEALRLLSAFETEIDLFNTAVGLRNLDSNGNNAIATDLSTLPFSTELAAFGGINTDIDTAEFDIALKLVFGGFIVDLRYVQHEKKFSNPVFYRPIDEKDRIFGLGYYVAENTSVLFKYKDSSYKGVRAFSDPLVAAFDGDIAVFDVALNVAADIIIAADPDDSLGINNAILPLGFGSIGVNPVSLDYGEKSYGIEMENVTEVDGDAYAYSAFLVEFIDRDDIANSDGLRVSAEFDYYFNTKFSLGAFVEIDNAGVNDVRRRTFELRSKYYFCENFGIEARYVMSLVGDLNVGLQTVELDDSEEFYIDFVAGF